MKLHFLKIAGIAITILFTACAKDTDVPETENPATQGSFIWQPVPGTSVTADSAYYYSQFTTIFAFKNGNNNSIEINLSALSNGTYAISSVSGNAFTYVSGATTYVANSGSFVITSSANNKLSGNFNVNFSGGTISAMSGNFMDIIHR